MTITTGLIAENQGWKLDIGIRFSWYSLLLTLLWFYVRIDYRSKPPKPMLVPVTIDKDGKMQFVNEQDLAKAAKPDNPLSDKPSVGHYI